MYIVIMKTAYLLFYIGEIENVLIPIIDLETQIAVLIQDSFKLKSDSEALLNKAKRAVELAIETNEQTANYLGI